MDAMSTEIDRIAGTTTWAGANLMEAATTDFSFQVGAATGTQNQISVDIKSMNTVGLGLDGGTSGVTEVTAVEGADAYTLTSANLSNSANITGDVFASADVTITLTDAAGATLASVDITAAADDSVNATAITNAFTAFGVTAAGELGDGSTHTDGDGIKLTFTEVAAVTAVAGVSPLAAGNNISVEDTSTGSGDADDNALASIVLLDAAIAKVNVQRFSHFLQLAFIITGSATLLEYIEKQENPTSYIQTESAIFKDVSL
jgi:flagellin